MDPCLQPSLALGAVRVGAALWCWVPALAKAALSVHLTGLWPVAHHSQGNAHQQYQDATEGDKPREGAQLELAFHHHHIILAFLFGFALAFGELALGFQGILFPG